MHDDMQYDPIHGLGHEPLKVGNPAIFKSYCIVVISVAVLLCRDKADSEAECRDYNFDMTALADHLRRQIDQNRNASYFNIDILKYQVWI